MTNLANKIKELRISLALSQEEFAKTLGYKSKSSINKIELGINKISYSKLSRLVQIYNINLENFLKVEANESTAKIIYPKFISKGDTIGICSPSFGCPVDPYRIRMEEGIKSLKELGFNIKETKGIRTLNKLRSAPADIRAKEFQKLYLDDNIDYIYATCGGEVLMEIMPLIDFNKIRTAKPKWFKGSSDNTWLTFYLTTALDIATMYGYNLASLGGKPWHNSIEKSIEFMKGNISIQTSFDKYEAEELKGKPGLALAGINDVVETCWKHLYNEKAITLNGRIIGGCLEVLYDICGSKFDKVESFLNRYKNDGFIWYIENYGADIITQYRALWKFKQAGWFKYCNGILIGRTANNSDVFDYTYTDALKDAFNDLNVPVIYDVDIGHCSPTFTIINGSIVKIYSSNGKGTLETFLK